MIFFHLAAICQALWKQHMFAQKDSVTAKLTQVLHPLISRKMEVFINDEGLMQAICMRPSFTHHLAAERPCTTQPEEFCLLVFYMYIYTHTYTYTYIYTYTHTHTSQATHHYIYPSASLFSRSMTNIT